MAETSTASTRIMMLSQKRLSKYHNKSFAFPYGFGCGLANGDWNIVENMLNTYFGDMNVTIYRLSARSDEV